jgi:hypothetical protein
VKKEKKTSGRKGRGGGGVIRLDLPKTLDNFFLHGPLLSPPQDSFPVARVVPPSLTSPSNPGALTKSSSWCIEVLWTHVTASVGLGPGLRGCWLSLSEVDPPSLDAGGGAWTRNTDRSRYSVSHNTQSQKSDYKQSYSNKPQRQIRREVTRTIQSIIVESGHQTRLQKSQWCILF